MAPGGCPTPSAAAVASRPARHVRPVLARRVLAVASLAITGCSPYGGGIFVCQDSTQCTEQGLQGTCQPNGLCSFPDLSGTCDSGQRYGDLAGELSHLCVGTPDKDEIDAALPLDASVVDAPPGTPCYGSGFVVECLKTAPAAPLDLGDTMIDTKTDARCAMVVAGGNLDACVIAGKPLTVSGTVRAKGSRPLVLISETTLDVSGRIDVSSKRGDDGAAANSSACVAGQGATLLLFHSGGGGYGGSFGGKGGTGETNDGGAGGVPPNAAPAPTSLRGGCRGSDGALTMGSRGPGGGAVYLIAKESITIGGAINASGGGGGGATDPHFGAGGGGSGGMIGLEAPSVTIEAGAHVYANGGSGGEGQGKGNGRDGTESRDGAVAKGGAGGASDGGDGGDGAAGTKLDGNNAPGNAKDQGGGGGGGGGAAGVIKVTSPMYSHPGLVSPPAT